MKESIDYNEFLKELKEQYGRCEKLFNIAWDINNNKDTKYDINDFPKMVLSDMSAVTQTLSFLIDRLVIKRVADDISEVMDREIYSKFPQGEFIQEIIEMK